MLTIVRTVSRRFDREGRRIELAFPDGAEFWTARDGLGRAIDDYQGPHGSTAHIMTAFAYDAAGRRSYFARRFGDMTAYGYDPAGRLAAQHDGGFQSGTGDTHSTFAYNPAGQLSSESRSNDAYAWTGSVAASRAYETNGQNQYKASGAATFDYDANGNLTSTVNAPWSATYAYDAENRLVSASGTHNATLVYDPLGRLFQISSHTTGTTQFLYDGDELIAEYDAYGNLLRRYIHGDGSDDPIYWYEGAGFDQPRFPHSNHQGSITAIAGPGSALLAINTYDEYGIPGKQIGRFGYTGQAWMPELGLWYYKARFYSPYMGRFLQVDPIGYEDQTNLYAYVRNDPVNGTDPTGMQGCSDAGKDVQAGLGGACVESSNYNEKKDGDLTVVSTPEIDKSAGHNMPSVANDKGPGENIAQFSQSGSDVTFTPLSTSTTEGNETLQGRATPIGRPDAIGHSHTDLAKGQTNIAPGYENKRIGDHVQVNAGRPNYIINSGITIVIERSQGQFRARVISGTPAKSQLKGIRSQLNRLQKGSRQ